VALPGRTSILSIVLQEALVQEVIVDILDLDPPRLPIQLAEDMVAVGTLDPVQGAQLRSALEPARGRLVNVNVHDAGFVGVLLDVKVDGRQPDGFARQPADALEREHGVWIVGEGFVLGPGVVSSGLVHGEEVGIWGKICGGYTMTKVPVRSLMVTSGGAAMVS